jgi:hypothetical protein
MTDGLILLGFLAALAAVVVARTRRRLGFSVTSRVIALTIIAFVIAVLVLWATSRTSR